MKCVFYLMKLNYVILWIGDQIRMKLVKFGHSRRRSFLEIQSVSELKPQAQLTRLSRFIWQHNNNYENV